MACRRRAAPAELVRLVADGDRILVSRTGAGRGAWLCPSRACLDRAVRSRAIPRALRCQGELDLAGLEATLEGGNGARRGVRG